jgi:hypothetical protein
MFLSRTPVNSIIIVEVSIVLKSSIRYLLNISQIVINSLRG